MSIRLMEDVFRSDLSGTRKLILLALADNANDSGFCWPNQETIARKASISTRNLRTHLHALEADGWLSVLALGNGRGHSSEYLLNVARIKGEKADDSVTKADPGDGKADPTAIKADLGIRPTVIEPSDLQPSEEPSVVRQKTRIDEEYLMVLASEFPRIDVNEELANYYNRTTAQINRHPDQRRAFRNWLKNADKWTPQPRRTSGQPAVSIGATPEERRAAFGRNPASKRIEALIREGRASSAGEARILLEAET